MAKSEMPRRLQIAVGFLGVILFSPSAVVAQVESTGTLGKSTAAGEHQEVTWSDQRPFAIVELFTSQGCSSCPPADKNLQYIVEQSQSRKQKVYALSFHVDYWNYIGWTDPFSLETATHRQRLYAGVHNSEQVYTPQMVVNGTTEFLGSSRDKSQRAIAAALKAKPTARVGLVGQRKDDSISVQWKTERAVGGDLLVVALVQQSGHRSVNAGENAGRKLSHANIVRDFQVADASAASGEISFSVPTEDSEASTDDKSQESLRLVAFVQTNAAVMRAAVEVPVKASENDQ